MKPIAQTHLTLIIAKSGQELRREKRKLKRNK